MLSEQATEIPYSPSDGVDVDGSAPLQVRNAFVVANEDGSLGNLVAAVVNPTDQDLTLNIGLGDSDHLTVDVPANSVKSLGTEDTPPLLIEGLDVKAGATVKMYFQSGDKDGIATQVPVLDGTLSYYSQLVPTPTPTPTPTATDDSPSPTPTP